MLTLSRRTTPAKLDGLVRRLLLATLEEREMTQSIQVQMAR
jgi:hypothetical protein